MLNALLHHLIESKVITVREVADRTGRGESTVYRWLKNESQPEFEDVRRLVKSVRDARARQALVDLFTHDLPLEVEWMTDGVELDEPRLGGREPEAIDGSMLAMDCLTDLLLHQRLMLRDGADAEQRTRAVALIDDAIRYLKLTRRVLLSDGAPRRKARTVVEDD